MPRYFFDTNYGSHGRDELGAELPDVAAAEMDAIRFCGDLLKHEPMRLAMGSLAVEVRDEGHNVVFCIEVTKRAPGLGDRLGTARVQSAG